MNATFTALPSEAVLVIEGPDTLTFLQGQTTCDTRDLSDTQTLNGLFCSPQGRALADFLLVQQTGERVLLRLRDSIAGNIRDTLAKYIAFSKAELTDDGDRCQVYGLSGADARACLEQTIGSAPSGRGAVISADNAFIVQQDESGLCLLYTSPSPRDA